MPVDVTIEPLTQAHDRSTFRCGIPSFDKYLRGQAGRDAGKCLSAVFVAELPGNKVAGYCTLSSATVLLPDLLGSGQRAASRYPDLIAARLTRLAVDERYRGKGYGGALLHNMIERLRQSPLKPMALIADIHNGVARCFLEHAGFQCFADQPDRAFRTLR